MTFLPIVDRELRVAARRRSTYWLRSVISLLAVVVGSCIFIWYSNAAQKTVGPHIFIGLAILALIYCVIVGRHATADCLSEEKREGTLGLLFLTDLKGYDVVLGKLAATSVNGFYALLAVFPVLAVPLLMGGVSSGEFWRMALALMNTFLFSLAVGIFVSSFSRDARRVVTMYFAVLLFFLVLLPAMGAVLVYYINPSLVVARWLFFASPGCSFVLSFDLFYNSSVGGYANADNYIWAMGTVHALTWLLVLLACWIAPRSWQDRPGRRGKRSWREFWEQSSFGSPPKRKAFRRRLLDINAFYWLAARHRLKPWLVWAGLSMIGLWWLIGWLTAGQIWFDDSIKVTGAALLNLLLKVWIGVESSQRLAEEQKMGSLELLLSTPLTVGDIVRGQFLALRRQFLAPICAVLAIEFWILYLLETSYRREAMMVGILIWGLVMLLADVAALFWVAMLAALITRNPSHAPITTITRVLLLPWIPFVFVTVLSGLMRGGPNEYGWQFYLGWWVACGLCADLGYGLAAWWKLRMRFRDLAALRFSRATARPAA